MKLTEAQRDYLVYMASVPAGIIVGGRHAEELEGLGLIRFVECSDGDYFEFTSAGRAALRKEAGE